MRYLGSIFIVARVFLFLCVYLYSIIELNAKVNQRKMHCCRLIRYYCNNIISHSFELISYRSKHRNNRMTVILCETML